MARKTPEVNSSSTADMAFLLLCFFMMTTTMDQDKGLSRRLPPMPDPNHKLEDQKVNKRNIVVVKINSQDRLLVGSKPMLVSELREEVKRFIKNPYADETLPEKKDTVITYMNKPYEFQISIADLKMTDTVLYLAYLFFGGAIVALITSWIVGAVRK